MKRPPKEERVQFNVDYAKDTDFSANARLVQSKWRSAKGFPFSKYGNFLESDFGRSHQVNFLTENIRSVVAKALDTARLERGLINEERLWNNLLSSQPLCFNLFSELSCDMSLATMVFRELYPDLIEEVTKIRFEYSPGRGDLKFIGDHSAFDVFVEYKRGDCRGFLGIEVKFAESMKEEGKAKADKNFKDRYVELSLESGAFNIDNLKMLRNPPISQIWRDHLLAIATSKDFDEGSFIFMFPINNTQCKEAVNLYRSCLSPDYSGIVHFRLLELERFIDALNSCCRDEWIEELRNRYIVK